MIVEEEFAHVAQRPAIEYVKPSFGSSLFFQRFTGGAPNQDPIWHYHPEVELVFIKSGHGKRHIGSHISYYTSGDLILIGSNLPHYGFSHRLTARNTEMIVQFKPDFLGKDFFNIVEFVKIAELLDHSQHGLSFYGNTKEEVGILLEEMVVMSHFDRLLHTIKILKLMADSDRFHLLNGHKPTIKTSKQDKDRVKVVYDFVRINFQRDMTLLEIANEMNMTIPSFCRYFKKRTGNTFTQFVNEFRVIHACKLLSETGRSISDICFDCGFNNFSHFNKQFKLITKKNPTEYRSEFREVVIA